MENAMTRDMAGRTGERCPETGEYACETHPRSRILIVVGELFPPCYAGNGHKAGWVNVADE